MFSAAEITRPGSSDSGRKLMKRVSGKSENLKYIDQSLEDGLCGT